MGKPEKEKVVEALCRGYCKACGGKIEGTVLDFSRLVEESEPKKCFQCMIKEIEKLFRAEEEIQRLRKEKEKK